MLKYPIKANQKDVSMTLFLSQRTEDALEKRQSRRRHT
jgi:hypothetical protein